MVKPENRRLAVACHIKEAPSRLADTFLKLSPGDEGIHRHILELEAARTAPTEVLDELRKIKGVGQARAKALVDAGFTTPDDFAKASAKDLMAVRGITRKIAEDLVEHFKAAIAETASR